MRRFFLGLFAFTLMLTCGEVRTASAHPMLQDHIEIAMGDRIAMGDYTFDVTVRSSLRTIVASLGREPLAGAFYEPAEIGGAVRDFVPYLLAHLRFEADGVVLAPKVIGAELEKPLTAPVHRRADVDGVFAIHRLRLEARRPLGHLRLEHSMLDDIVDGSRGGGRWVLDYFVEVKQVNGAASMQVLRPNMPLEIATGTSEQNGASVFLEFAKLGATHIMGGFDHLLFLAAVVLGAGQRARSLVLVVLAFTVAHTTTLALASFGLVAISSRVVEPLIGLSIVVAAAAAARSHGSQSDHLRVGIAFVFGLVHGLGFASGLLDALQGDRTRVAIALVAFTIGVEVVQQLLIVPVHLAARSIQARSGGRTWIERAALVVMVLGLLFLIQALKRAA